MNHTASCHSGAHSAFGRRVLGGAITASLALGCGLLGGCDEPSSPRGAVQRAAVALLSKDDAALRSSLSGSALRRFSEHEGVQALEHALRGRDLELAPAKLRYRDEHVAGFDRLRVYSVAVQEKAGGQVALEAMVLCQVHWISRDGYAYRDPLPVQPRELHRLTEGYTPVESCRISDVKLGGEAPPSDPALCQGEPPPAGEFDRSAGCSQRSIG